MTDIHRRTANDGRVVLEDVPEIPVRIAEDLRPFHHIRSAVFEDFSADGESIYVATRFAATAQLHRVDRPGGARRQLTFDHEPVQETRRRPGSNELVFLMDSGGDERYQIHSLDPQTGARRELTAGLEGRNGSLLWSPDGKFLAYRSTRRNGRSSDVWVMDPDRPDDARMVLEAPNYAWWAPAAWSPDGRLLAILEYRSITHCLAHVVDLEGGETHLVAGNDEGGVFHPMGFSEDGEHLILTTDAEGECTQLAALPLNGEKSPGAGELRLISGELDHDVTSFQQQIAGRTTKAAFVVNEDGYGRIYLLDSKTWQYRPLEGLPKGLAGRLRFSADGRRLGFVVDTSTRPADVWTVELGEGPFDHGRPERWTFSETGGLAASSFVEPELIHYPSFDDDPATGERRRIPAFVYRPKGDGPHPVVLRIHGGPESQFRPSFNPSLQAWVDRLGVAVIAPNVRGSSGYGKTYLRLDDGYLREDSVKDIGALLDWIADQDAFDTDRVAVYGGSYGGYMVLASLVHYSDRLRCGVDLVGISNFVTFLENTQSYRRDLRRQEYGDERDPDMRAFLERISPSSNAERIQVPLFVAQGHNDPRVPYTEAEQIAAAVRRTGKKVWYLDALDEGHGFRKKENRDLFERAAVLFLQTHLL